MHISKLSLINYRNFANAKLLFKKGINTVIGENSSGKTNLFRAIRLLLDDNLLRAAYKLDEKDFYRGLKDWRGHWIIISLEFEEVSQEEAIQSLFLHGTGNLGDDPITKATYNLIFRPKPEIRHLFSQLEDGDKEGLESILRKITVDNYETIFTGKSEADFNDENVYRQLVGDFDQVKFSKDPSYSDAGIKLPDILSVSKDICFTYVQALRDVVSEFQNNRTNPLLTLLKSKSEDIDSNVIEPIVRRVRELNNEIEKLTDVKDLRDNISTTIKDAAGVTYSPSSLLIKSDLPEEANKLLQSLKLFVGEDEDKYESPIHELSLGGANLVYLTLKLLEFKYQKSKQSFANFLLIEEPEAHIHTHIQKTLFDRLSYSDTQIIYSTHSTHISEVSNVENINILGKRSGRCEAYQPAAGLTEPQIGNIQRYLDAVRSNLLFAKSVILVEGDAEEILIPILVKKALGISLDEMGISLINIRSTGFQNVAVLFADSRIKKRCSIITDFDAAFIDVTPTDTDSEDETKFKNKCRNAQNLGIARKAELEVLANDNIWLCSFFASHTFEIDFITAGNADKAVNVLGEIYKTTAKIAQAKEELESRNIEKYGRRILTMAENQGKGWFAILLGKKIDHQTIIPDYILDAIFFASAKLSHEAWFNILNYRLSCIKDSNQFPLETVENFQLKLNGFRSGEVEFLTIRNEMLLSFPADHINHILERFNTCLIGSTAS